MVANCRPLYVFMVVSYSPAGAVGFSNNYHMNTIVPNIGFFKESQRIKEELMMELGWAGPRNFQSFTFGRTSKRPYLIFRDRTNQTSEYILLFNRHEFIGVNVCFPAADTFKFDSDTFLHSGKEDISQALFALFEFVVWDANRKGIRNIYGNFSANAGYGYTNEPILKALDALGFLIVYNNPKDPLCTKFLVSKTSAIEQAWLQSGLIDKRYTRSYYRVTDKDYYFISCKPLPVNKYLYTLVDTPERFCQLYCQVENAQLQLTNLQLQSTDLSFFALLVNQIIFDTLHRNLPHLVNQLNLKIDLDSREWMTPILTQLDFKETCTIGSSTFTLSL